MNERVTYRTVRHEAYVGASRVELYVLSLSPFFSFPFCSVNVLVSLIKAAVFSSITSGYHSVFFCNSHFLFLPKCVDFGSLPSQDKVVY